MNMEKSRGEGEGGSCIWSRRTGACLCPFNWRLHLCYNRTGPMGGKRMLGKLWYIGGPKFWVPCWSVSLGGSTGSGKGKCEGNHRHFAFLDYLHVCCVVCNGIIVAIVAIRRGARLRFRVTQWFTCTWGVNGGNGKPIIFSNFGNLFSIFCSFLSSPDVHDVLALALSNHSTEHLNHYITL